MSVERNIAVDGQSAGVSVVRIIALCGQSAGVSVE